MTTITTATATGNPVQTPRATLTLDGHWAEQVPAGCILLNTDDLSVGDVLQHAPGTFDLVTHIDPVPSETTRQVHVLRTLPSGRTAACFFWVGEHARRTVHQVVVTPTERG